MAPKVLGPAGTIVELAFKREQGPAVVTVNVALVRETPRSDRSASPKVCSWAMKRQWEPPSAEVDGRGSRQITPKAVGKEGMWEGARFEESGGGRPPEGRGSRRGVL